LLVVLGDSKTTLEQTQKKDSILFSGATQKRVPETRLGAHSIPGEVVPLARVRTRRHALLPPDGDEDGILQSLCQRSEEGHDTKRRKKADDKQRAAAAAVDENGANRHAETV